MKIIMISNGFASFMADILTKQSAYNLRVILFKNTYIKSKY